MFGFFLFCGKIVNMLDILTDAFIDSVKIFPFILIIYVLMEVIENARNKEKIEKALSGSFAPVISASMGVIPECGFAVMCAKLYDKGLIKIGTVIAAFIAISDEGLIVLISGGAAFDKIALLLCVKIVYAIIIGMLVNLIFSKKDSVHVCSEKGNCIECGQTHNEPFDKYFIHPLMHTLTTFLYILVLNIIFNSLIYFIGSDNVAKFIDSNYYLQPVVSTIVGLIPNCASSIIISTAYLNGALGFAGLVAGLSANAGIGILILFKSRKNIKKALLIMFIMFLSGLLIGYLLLPFKI